MKEPSMQNAVSRLAPLTAVIPCYRSQATIVRAIDSVYSQSWRPAEVIIVDDSSPDDTYEFLKRVAASYPAGWIKLFRREKNGGPGLARNDGWDAATQRYVAFLDADDTWHSAKTELQLRYMIENQTIDITSTKRILFSEHAVPSDISTHKLTFENMLWHNYTSISGTILKRMLPHRFPLQRRLCEDYSLWLAILAANCNAILMEAPLAYAHKAAYGESGLSAQLWAMQRNELSVYAEMRQLRKLSLSTYLKCSAYSLAKFSYRVANSIFMKRK